MAQQLYFSRDTKVYVEIGSDVWELPVLDGFSFSQATNSSEITLAEMESTAGVSRRGRRAFNDSLAPAEWSFSTYVRPFISAGGTPSAANGLADSTANHHAVEEVLWALFSGPAAYASSTFTNQFTADATDLDIDFSESNKSTLGTANIYFVVGNANKKSYKLASSVVNEASIDFDIDGIAMINWSGFASEITDDTANGLPTATIYESILDTTNFIRNRLTTLAVVPTTQDPDGDSVNELEASYALTLTGGNITMSNNITFITPEEIGTVNIPIGHVTGTRSVSGSMTCYLSKDTGLNTHSSDLWEDMKSITNVVTNSFALTFNIGGTASSTPRLSVAMPTCHLEIPTHSIEDVISVETNFMSLPSTIDQTDEATLKYIGA